MHSQPQATSAGNGTFVQSLDLEQQLTVFPEVLSNVNFATKRLKDLWMAGDDETSQTFEEITRYLS